MLLENRRFCCCCCCCCCYTKIFCDSWSPWRRCAARSVSLVAVSLSVRRARNKLRSTNFVAVCYCSYSWRDIRFGHFCVMGQQVVYCKNNWVYGCVCTIDQGWHHAVLGSISILSTYIYIYISIYTYIDVLTIVIIFYKNIE